MPRNIILGLIVLVPSAACADVGVALRPVPFQITLTVDRDYPDVEFFLVEFGHEKESVIRIAPTANAPAIVNFKAGHRRSSFGYGLYIIPKSALQKLDQMPPPASWFETMSGYSAKNVIHVWPFLDVFDNRAQIERTYQIRYDSSVASVELLLENKGSRWVAGLWGGACCGLPLLSAALIPLLILWLAKRKRCRQNQ